MKTAKIRKLQVRPSQSADLSFNMPGILSRQNNSSSPTSGLTCLGQRIEAYKLEDVLYPKLRETLPADPAKSIVDKARLKYDADEILQELTDGGQAPYLFALRNESVAAALSKLINQRENLFLQKFMHSDKLSKSMKETYDEIIPRLLKMLKDDKARYEALKAAYNATDSVRTGPITKTGPESNSHMNTTTAVRTPVVAMWNTEFGANSGQDPEIAPKGKNITSKVLKGSGDLLQKHEGPQTASIPHLKSTDNKWKIPEKMEYNPSNPEGSDVHFTGQVSYSKTVPATQISVTDNPQYTHPSLNNEIEHERFQTTIRQELMRIESQSHQADHLNSILANELKSLDDEVRNLQLNYIHTFLTSPINGVVTAIYKDLGESVEPGEPVMRVEDDQRVYLIGQVQYRGRLGINQAVRVVSKNIFESGTDVDIPGKIVTIRGHSSDNDEWDIIIECENLTIDSGERLLPINYQFDHDDAEILVE